MTETSPLKKNLLLINKADLLTEQQREAWAQYLTSQGISFAFFSAITEDEEESETTEAESAEMERVNSAEEGEGEEEPTLTKADSFNQFNFWREPLPVLEVEGAAIAEEPHLDTATVPSPAPCHSTTEVLSSDRLISLFRSYKRHSTESITVGFTGYPNVGKSSTINKLLQAKKVRVSETPGKTKHFQTLVLADDLTVCDCPGLVMPSIVNSKAGMVLQGILPIHQLRDHVPATQLLLSRIPCHVLEAVYGLVLPRPGPLTPEQLLTAYGTLKGFMTTGGRPDQVMFLARAVLKLISFLLQNFSS